MRDSSIYWTDILKFASFFAILYHLRKLDICHWTFFKMSERVFMRSFRNYQKYNVVPIIVHIILNDCH